MPEERDESKPYDCFVAFMDIMGFKERLLREGHEKINEMFESMHPTIDALKKEALKLVENKEKRKSSKNTQYFKQTSVFPVSFSDSIILFSSDDSKDSALDITINAAVILSEAIKHEIPMKGAVAFGKMTINKDESLYFGQPLIDAYELHKELEIYGVVLHHTTQKRFELLGMEDWFDSLLFVQYLIPMKSGKIRHHLVNWVSLVKNPQDSISKLYGSVSGTPRKYVDNTLEFFHETEAKKQALFAELEKKGLIEKTKD
ncbi:MAG: hypothetical protein A2Z15_05045 [Chloroflexi bacterium RBG_16_50_11]|nr:MAG: hypothetical protein A2Z15_05045 [Chloroflexi bacterium RBG_16_50_11]